MQFSRAIHGAVFFSGAAQMLTCRNQYLILFMRD
jgi:hypothetical protein